MLADRRLWFASWVGGSHNRRSRSPSSDAHRRKRRREGSDGERDRHRSSSTVPASGGSKEQKKQVGDAPGGAEALATTTDIDPDELEMMNMMGIPTGFDSTKGKPVSGNDVSGVKAVTKRQPRQYMNRRGGFNRPLPQERNR
ncbi:hypothetical protein ZIOFF_048851 [Zingiber officinale]|uniref:U4/U6.U5 small nuclear ribonucleoprotein 27kDa protein domain-containing protein n=1 Tax=Zingiber officinale TaxID=94328 RepID=A0A8J5KX18_ZINOF|nr:hypothetical protein ZIOFF_048851 [Zingiber officinale]